MPRKELEAGCDGGIFCPVDGHVETVSGRGGRLVVRHRALTKGQKRSLHEHSMAMMRARRAWIEARHGALSNDAHTYEDGTHWKVAAAEWKEHLSTHSIEQESAGAG